MAWHLRVIESEDGRWVCHWGRRKLDTHGEVEEALEHLREIADEVGDFRFFVHHLGGAVTEL